jgi:hypothetical protein
VLLVESSFDGRPLPLSLETGEASVSPMGLSLSPSVCGEPERSVSVAVLIVF